MKEPACRDLGVFDFKEEDELSDTYAQWCKLSNPKYEDPAMTKYQFLHCASTASVAQMKEVDTMEHVQGVTVDGDSHGFINDVTHGSLNLLENAGSRQLEGLGAIPDRPFEQHCHIMEDSVNLKSLSSGTENGSVDTGTSDGHDSIPKSSPSTPTSLIDENNVLVHVQSEDQSLSRLKLEEMDVVLHTDYVTYCNKYYPASDILISKNSVKLKLSVVEGDSSAFRLEWDVNEIVRIESHWSSVASVAKVKLYLLTKNALQAEIAQCTSDVDVLEFLFHDPDWCVRQKRIMQLNVRYKTAWSIGLNGTSGDEGVFPVGPGGHSSDPYIPNFEEPFEEVVYPNGDVDAVSISKRDVDLLQPEIFINDTIIDFYTKYLKNQLPPQERHRFHFFNSFFFRKLADLDKNPSNAFDGKAAFQRVRKWTRKVNIFEKDYIFIPVNYNLHWSLIVICHPGEVANFSDENMDETLGVPCILHMDSIRGSHMGLKDIVQSYLLEEWKERQKETSEDIHSKFSNLRFLSLELPQQENCSDCGLFLLHYAELFIAEAPANFSPFMINKFENFLKPGWFMPPEASLKRVQIQRLIYVLLESHSQTSASPSSDHESHLSALLEHNKNDNGIEIISENRSPVKSSNGNLYSQSAQGMELGLLNASPCINDSGMGVRALLEQCQHYDQEASFEQLRCPISSARKEVETDEHVGCSTLGTMDGVASGACLTGYSSRGFGEGFVWNLKLSDQAEGEGNSPPMSNCSSDDSKESRINESQSERHSASSAQDENLEQSKANVDDLTESYASASSDTVETPAEDFQELDKIYGSNDQKDPRPSDIEDVVQASLQVLDTNESGIVACDDEKMVVEDSSSDSDEEQTAKRIRVTPMSE